jgi:prevent-host-death family protein
VSKALCTEKRAIMYIMKWTIAEARENFANLLQHANKEPQSIFNRNRFVAAVIDAETFEAFETWQKERRASLANALDELTAICQQDDYELVIPKRQNRSTPFDQ